MMNKFLLSTALGGSLLLSGATGASPLIIDTPTGLWGNVTITNFSHPGGPPPGRVPDTDGTFNVDFADLQGPSNTVGIVDLFNASITNGHKKFCGSGFFDPSGDDPANPGPDTRFFNFPNCVTVFTGTASDTWPVSSLTFNTGGSPAPINTPATITYNGDLSLFNAFFGLPVVSVNGSLSIAFTSITDTTLDLTVTETCNGGTCIEALLTAIDNGVGVPDGIIGGAFRFDPNSRLIVPEPATLALLSVGLAGLGFIRRKKAA